MRTLRQCAAEVKFQSTPSVGRATKYFEAQANATQFQSTPSVGRATIERVAKTIRIEFQSTPSVGRATLRPIYYKYFDSYFNPRPPWGGRQIGGSKMRYTIEFQSTPSVGRATISRCCSAISERISIHALRGEGDVYSQIKKPARGISIHALRGEGDISSVVQILGIGIDFNPRPPWGGRPYSVQPDVNSLYDFNPRPPWGGRHNFKFELMSSRYFNPRPPWGGRLKSERIIYHAFAFQSTPSVGRATRKGTPRL